MRELMAIFKACSAGRKAVSPRGACAAAGDAEPGTGRGIICGSAAAVWMDARLSIPRAVSNLVTQPCLPPTRSRYLHLPLSNHFFLWLLKLTHFDILRGEKWEVLLEIALMCCTGEALFEEQAMRVLSELYFYLPFNNSSLFYFVLNKNSCGCLSYRKTPHKNTLLRFGCSLFPVMKGTPA